MGFPWNFEENFETGDKGSFTTLVDTTGIIDFPGPYDEIDVYPHRGAYVMRASLVPGNLTAGYVEDTSGHDTLAGATLHNRFYLYLSEDFDIQTDKQLWVFTLVTSSGADPCVFITKDLERGIQLGVAATSVEPAPEWGSMPISVGEWICVETTWVVDSGGGDDGYFYVTVNDHRFFIEKINSASVSSARYGVTFLDGTARGFLLFDSVVVDDTRLFPVDGPESMAEVDHTANLVTKSGWVFVGSGEVLKITAIDGGSGDVVVKVYDTDRTTYAEHKLAAQVATPGANRTEIMDQSFNIYQGCYVKLEGTNPRAIVQVGVVDEFDYDDDDEDDL